MGNLNGVNGEAPHAGSPFAPYRFTVHHSVLAPCRLEPLTFTSENKIKQRNAVQVQSNLYLNIPLTPPQCLYPLLLPILFPCLPTCPHPLPAHPSSSLICLPVLFSCCPSSHVPILLHLISPPGKHKNSISTVFFNNMII